MTLWYPNGTLISPPGALRKWRFTVAQMPDFILDYATASGYPEEVWSGGVFSSKWAADSLQNGNTFDLASPSKPWNWDGSGLGCWAMTHESNQNEVGGLYRARLFDDLRSLRLSGMEAVQTTGYNVHGFGAATYVRDASVDADAVAANPLFMFTSLDGLGFRLADGEATPFMFGGQDATGIAYGADEVVYDNSAVLAEAWRWLIASPGKRSLDFSTGQGWGVSTTFQMFAPDIAAWWNNPVFRLKAGRFVVVPTASLDRILNFRGKRFSVEGKWFLQGGTDAVGGAGFKDYRSRDGALIEDASNSSYGDFYGMSLRRYLVRFATDAEALPGANNIGASVGDCTAVSCGSTGATALAGFGGNYAAGAWNGVASGYTQRHSMDLTPATGVSVDDVKVGDPVLFNGVDWTIVTAIGAKTAAKVRVTVFPAVQAEASGTFQCFFGGPLEIVGSNVANVTFGLVYGLACGIGLRARALYASNIKSLLAESCGIAFAYGDMQAAGLGLMVDTAHMENNQLGVLDCAGAGAGYTAVEIGALSAYPSLNSMLKITPNYTGASGSVTFTRQDKRQPLAGLTMTYNGKRITAGATTYSSETAGSPLDSTDAVFTLSNHPPYDQPPSRYGNTSTVDLVASGGAARVYDSRVCEWGPFYGSGINGAPTGGVIFTTSQPDVTINGVFGPVTVTNSDGALAGYAVFSPNESGDTGNWRIFSRALKMG